jgi:radical SAM protein with 4Fe4S-binding SPASM domain
VNWNDFHPCKEISIEITNKCDLRCAHCSSEGGDPFPKELSLKQILDIINNGVKNMGTEQISLSGGEPMLRPDFSTIVEEIRKLDLKLLVYTSGNYKSDDTYRGYEVVSVAKCNVDSLVQKNMAAIKDGATWDNTKVILSMEGLELTHDALTRYPGSYRNVLESIEAFQKEGLRVEVHTTPTRMNMYQLEEIYEVCRRLQVNKMSILRLVPQGRCVGYDTELSPNVEEMAKIIWELHKIKAKSDAGYIPNLRIGDPLNWEFFFDRSVCRNCHGGIDRVLVRSNGEAQFCAALKHAPKYNYGNVMRNSLEKMWVKSPVAIKLRKLHYGELDVKICNKCEYYKNCRGGCTSQRIATYGDMLWGPDPLCTKDIIYRR